MPGRCTQWALSDVNTQSHYAPTPVPSDVTPTVQSTPTVLVAPQLPTAPVSVDTSSLPRRSSRMNRGQTSRFQEFATGGEYDAATESGQVLYAVQLQVPAIWNGYQWAQWFQPVAGQGR